MTNGNATGPTVESDESPASGNKVSAAIYALIVLLFFVSGFSSLIYQVVWTRSLVFVFGSTTFASSTVLAVFMGGLALGSFIAGRSCDRMPLWKTFLWYGILEGIIGLWAVIAPAMFSAAIPLYRTIWQATHVSVLPFSILRFVVAAFILLLPTTCMGATLPLLSRYVAGSLKFIGNRIGTLYSVNTLGAVVGSTVAGFYLLPSFGIATTTYLSAGCNAALCFAVVALTFALKRPADEVAPDDQEKTHAAGAASPSSQQSAATRQTGNGRLPVHIVATMIAFAISGAVAMVYEVAWTRTLLMVIGSTTYAFTVMLSTFLAGIFVGSLVVAKLIDKSAKAYTWFVVCQIMLGLFGMMSIYLFNYVPFWNLQINAAFAGNPQAALYIRFLLSAAILVPITIFLGAIFPIAVKVCTQDLSSVGRSVGSLYSANTLGAIMGAFLAGFIVIPVLGAEKTLIGCTVINVLLAAGLELFAPPAEEIKYSVRVASIVAAVAIAVFALNRASAWDHLVMLSAQPERRVLASHKVELPATYEEWRDQIHQHKKLRAWYDGACATVGVYESPTVRSLLTNGHVDASNASDMTTQVLLAAYPMMMAPHTKDIAVIGWGCGVTIGTAARKPDTNITAVEIEPAVLEAAKLFSDVNGQPDKNPRVNAELNDGRNYLLATDRKFDMIVSEPSNPWQAGVCNLFTREYFEASKRCLKPGGVFSLWLQISQISPENVVSVLSALHQQYPYIMPMWSYSGVVVVLASEKPLQFDYQQLSRVLSDPNMQKEFQRAGMNTPEDVIGQMVASPDQVDRLITGSGKITANSDDRNNLEYQVSKTYESRSFLADNRRMFDAGLGSLASCINWGTMTRTQQAEALLRIAQHAADFGDQQHVLAWAQCANAANQSAKTLVACGDAEYALGDEKAADNYYAMAIKDTHNDNASKLAIAKLYRTQGKLKQAQSLLAELLAKDPKNVDANYELALSVVPSSRRVLARPLQERFPDNAQLAESSLQKVESDPAFASRHSQILFVKAAVLNDQGKLADAEKVLKQYVRMEPTDIAALRMLSSIQNRLGKNTEASLNWSKSLEMGASLSQSLCEEAKQMLAQGHQPRAVYLIGKALELNPDNVQAVQILEQVAGTDKTASARLDVIRGGKK